MSQENVEIVRASIEAAKNGDFKTALSYFSEDVVFHPLVAGPYHGREGVVQQWRVFMEEFEDYWFEADDLIGAGDRVVLIWRHAGQGKASGIPVENRGATVFALESGQISSAWVYADPAEALKAAGLSE